MGKRPNLQNEIKIADRTTCSTTRKSPNLYFFFFIAVHNPPTEKPYDRPIRELPFNSVAYNDIIFLIIYLIFDKNISSIKLNKMGSVKGTTH